MCALCLGKHGNRKCTNIYFHVVRWLLSFYSCNAKGSHCRSAACRSKATGRRPLVFALPRAHIGISLRFCVFVKSGVNQLIVPRCGDMKPACATLERLFSWKRVKKTSSGSPLEASVWLSRWKKKKTRHCGVCAQRDWRPFLV